MKLTPHDKKVLMAIFEHAIEAVDYRLKRPTTDQTDLFVMRIGRAEIIGLRDKIFPPEPAKERG